MEGQPDATCFLQRKGIVKEKENLWKEYQAALGYTLRPFLREVSSLTPFARDVVILPVSFTPSLVNPVP